MIIAGIDYSMTSPAICVMSSNSWKDAKFFYFVGKPKNQIIDDQFVCNIYPEYNSAPERYDNLASWAVDILVKHNVEKVYIEGYSYGSVGRVFEIAENGGVLKHLLWKNKISYDTFAPSEIKKFATDKGNCDKSLMYDAWISETGLDLRKKLMIPKGWNPLSDIVDAFWIAKLGVNRCL